MFLDQQYHLYTEEDHNVWSTLFKRQRDTVVKNNASKTYQQGFNELALDPERIVNIEEFNKTLYQHSGWKIRGVEGLVPNKVFFEMLINKQFPVTVYIRGRDELDYAKGPDLFHDVIGHVPMILNEVFAAFMLEFSKISYKYIDYDKAVDYLSRLYWFTLEMGLIRENGEIKPYGGAIITSKNEVSNIYSNRSEKIDFNLRQLIDTPIKLEIQTEYFVIDNYDQLFDSLQDLELILEKEFSASAPAA